LPDSPFLHDVGGSYPNKITLPQKQGCYVKFIVFADHLSQALTFFTVSVQLQLMVGDLEAGLFRNPRLQGFQQIVVEFGHLAAFDTDQVVVAVDFPLCKFVPGAAVSEFDLVQYLHVGAYLQGSVHGCQSDLRMLFLDDGVHLIRAQVMLVIIQQRL
jgi:hypothetical protein